jgi:hypothetical protein
MNRTTRRDSSGEERPVDGPQSKVSARLLLRSAPRAMSYDNLGTAEVVASCAKTYGDEVARLTLLQDFDAGEIKRKASDLWRAVLPDLVDHRTTLAYIACIAWGTKMQLLTPQDTKAMMFMAQTQLSVLRGMADAMPKPKPIPSGELFPAAAQSSMEPA